MHTNVHAIVLKAEKVSEKDKRLLLFTKEKGRLYALVKGVARPGARLGASTDVGVESQFRLWMEEGRPYTRITGGALIQSFPFIKKDWSVMAKALFLWEWTELLTVVLHPYPEKYDLLIQALRGFEKGDKEIISAAFMVQFLEKAGYGLTAEFVNLSTPSSLRKGLEFLIQYDFSSENNIEKTKEWLPFLHDKIIKFVSPLLPRPFRSLDHEKKLKDYSQTIQEECESSSVSFKELCG